MRGIAHEKALEGGGGAKEGRVSRVLMYFCNFKCPATKTACDFHHPVIKDTEIVVQRAVMRLSLKL